MTIQELCSLASRLHGIVYDSEKLAMTREELQEEILQVARDLRRQADEIDLEMDRQFIQEYTHA